MKVVTRPLADDRPLLAFIPPGTDAVTWVRRAAGDVPDASVSPTDEGLVGWGVAATVRPSGPQRFTQADADLQELAAFADIDDTVQLPGSGLVGVGSFTFDPNATGSVLTIPRVFVGRRGGQTWITNIDPHDAPPVPEPWTGPVSEVGGDRPRFAGSSNPDLRWLEAVGRAIDWIRSEEALTKVVLARDYALWSKEPFDPLLTARRLHAKFPSCHTFSVNGLTGATPELLVTRSGKAVTSRVLAGTAARGADASEDAALGTALLASEKDRFEHSLAATSVSEVLAPICTQLTCDDEPQLLRLDNVQHLATRFDGVLGSPYSSLEIAGALHPTAAVGGTPRSEALDAIAALEGMDRGRYAAPVGWTGPDGDGEWGIALRCAELSGARARLFAGVGVVADSLPEDELEETRLKLRAMQSALDPTR